MGLFVDDFYPNKVELQLGFLGNEWVKIRMHGSGTKDCGLLSCEVR